MDGTLIDSEPYWMAAETPLVESFGGTWTHEDALQLVGLGLHDAARVLQTAGVRMEADAIVQHLTDEVLRQMGELGVPFRPGAAELLRSLRDAGIRTGLVTMSMHRMAAAMVDLLGFDAFDVVLGGDDVAHPKPHPDPYLHAARALDVDIAHTVAIEDSANGLRSAVASGAVSLGVPHFVSLDGVGAHALWPTLEGRDAEDVSALYRAHRS
ncbi:HAD family phosphatase [Microbacterium oryzae]|uniref:HAD family phosphatase n=2 Tax=Microbacterium oryzae TaxID=743009 RepID=A0A6I6DWZ9_9MICO|nr:HAD family phosphatase [Microbacterium oryzae]